MTDPWDRAAHAQMVLARARAMSVTCRYCGAQPDQPCVSRLGYELGRQPAHITRLQDTGAMT